MSVTQRKQNILIVEDDEDIRNALSEILGDQGYVVHEARNGLEGINFLNDKLIPELVLLDLMMPVKDGNEFLADIAADQRFINIPIIVMSANFKMLVTTNPIYTTIKKPLTIEQLLGAVKKILD